MVRSNTGRYLRDFLENIDYMFTGKTGNMLTRAGEKFGGLDEAQKVMAPQGTRNYINEHFYGKEGKITKAQEEMDKLRSGMDTLQGDELKKRQEAISQAETRMSGLRDDFDKALSGEYKGEGFDKAYQGKKGRLIDIYGPGNAANFVDFMNAGTTAQKATKYGMLGAAYFGAAGAVRGLSGGGVTYNASGERDIMGVPFF